MTGHENRKCQDLKIWGKLQGTMQPELSRITCNVRRVEARTDRLGAGITCLDVSNPCVSKGEITIRCILQDLHHGWYHRLLSALNLSQASFSVAKTDALIIFCSVVAD